MQNLSSLALKLRKDFEVTDSRHATPFTCGVDGKNLP